MGKKKVSVIIHPYLINDLSLKFMSSGSEDTPVLSMVPLAHLDESGPPLTA